MKRPAAVPSSSRPTKQQVFSAPSNASPSSSSHPAPAQPLTYGRPVASVHASEVPLEGVAAAFVPVAIHSRIDLDDVPRRRGPREGCFKEAALASGFRLKNTADLQLCGNPPLFVNYPLRDGQRQSLSFMVEQERRAVRFKAPAKQAVHKILNPDPNDKVGFETVEVRGGILGDRMGYGKTAITIGLVSMDNRGHLPLNPKPHDLFSSRATLIIAPSHLLQQWSDEFSKFLGDRMDTLKLIKIPDATALKKLRFVDLVDADVVLATTLVNADESDPYRRRLMDLGGMNQKSKHQRRTDLSEDLSDKGPGSIPTFSLNGWSCNLVARDMTTGSKVRHVQSNGLVKRGILENKYPVLEAFYWRRLVVDEFHESELWSEAKRQTITRMAANARWGLSGTPPIGDALSVSHMASLLGVQIHFAHHQILQQFLDCFVRQNSLETGIAVDERIVDVHLTAPERMLYRQECQDIGVPNPDTESDILASISAEARDRLLQRCADFSFDPDDGNAARAFSRVGDEKLQWVQDLETQLAMDCARFNTLESKVQSRFHSCSQGAYRVLQATKFAQCSQDLEKRIDAAVEAAQKHDWKGAHVRPSQCPSGHWTFKQPVPFSKYVKKDKERRSLMEALVAVSHGNELPVRFYRQALQVQEHALSALVHQLSDGLRSLAFFRSQLAVLEGSGPERTCSICMEEDVPAAELAITPCAHTFHISCLREWLDIQHRCPACRFEPMTIRHVSSLSSELEGKCAGGDLEIGNSKCTNKTLTDADLQQEYGSKIEAMLQTLNEIRRGDSAAKVLIFSQWDKMLDRIGAALAANSIGFLRVQSKSSRGRGTASASSGPLHEFQTDRRPSAAPVLLLSLENSASGSNLTAANHIFFVSPMSTDCLSTAIAYERQAVARVRRPGQERDRVCIWRFVSRGTVEEQITKRNQEEHLQA